MLLRDTSYLLTTGIFSVLGVKIKKEKGQSPYAGRFRGFNSPLFENIEVCVRFREAKLALFFAKAQQAEASRNAHQAKASPFGSRTKVSHTAKDSRRIEEGVRMYSILENRINIYIYNISI